MRSNWTPELEDLVRRADPAAEVIIEAAVIEDEDVRANYDGWTDADSISGFQTMPDGGIRIAGSTGAVIENTNEDGDFTDLNRASPFDVAQIEWNGTDPEDMEITRVRVRLDNDTGGGQDVDKWGCQIYALTKITSRGFLTLTPITDVKWEDAGVAEEVVTFDFGDTVRRPQPKKFKVEGGGQGWTGNPCTFVFIFAWDTDANAPATAVGWNRDTNTSSVTTDGNTLKGVRLTQYEDGQFSAAAAAGCPYIGIDTRSFSQQTLTYTTNPFDLSGSPAAADVEFVLEGAQLSGSALTGEADDGVAGWTEFKDGDRADDLGLTGPPYDIRVTFDPDATGAITPILRAVGIREIETTDITDIAEIEGARSSVDVVTLKAEIPTATIRALRDGEPDFQDFITNLLSEHPRGDIVFRVWVGHRDTSILARDKWMRYDDYFIRKYDASEAEVQLRCVTAIEQLRGKLPKYNTGTSTRSPLTYASTETLKSVGNDLMVGQLEVPARFVGPEIEDTTNVGKEIRDSEGKAELDAVAYLAGGAYISSQGRIKFVDFHGEKSAVAAFPIEEIRVLASAPDFDNRIPEIIVGYDWIEDENRYEHLRYRKNATALANLGKARINYETMELDHIIAQWIRTSALADTVAQRIVDRFGPGLIQIPFGSNYAYPELEPGDMVAVAVDSFIAIDPITARAIKGRLVMQGVVNTTIGILDRPQFVVWIREYADIFSVSEAGDPSGFLRFYRCKAYKSANQAISSNTAASFNLEAFDEGDIHDNATNNSRLTIPAGGNGNAIIKAHIKYTDLADGTVTLGIIKNGLSADSETHTKTSGTDPSSGDFDMVITEEVTAGDYYEIKVGVSGGSSITLVGGGEGDTSFSVVRQGVV